jgi:hypothetical protein
VPTSGDGRRSAWGAAGHAPAGGGTRGPGGRKGPGGGQKLLGGGPRRPGVTETVGRSLGGPHIAIPRAGGEPARREAGCKVILSPDVASPQHRLTWSPCRHAGLLAAPLSWEVPQRHDLDARWGVDVRKRTVMAYRATVDPTAQQVGGALE